MAEEALYTYLDRYPRGVYLADSYHTRALIALRRNYSDKVMDQKSSFADKINSLTNWARNNCSSGATSK